MIYKTYKPPCGLWGSSGMGNVDGAPGQDGAADCLRLKLGFSSDHMAAVISQDIQNKLGFWALVV